MTTVKEKDVAARFRWGDVLLKPQHEPDYGENITMLDATRTVGTALYAQRRDGAQGMCTGRRRHVGTRTQGGRNGEAQVAQPAAFAEREETWNDPRLNVEHVMKTEVQGLDEVFSYPHKPIPLRRAGRPERQRGAGTK